MILALLKRVGKPGGAIYDQTGAELAGCDGGADMGPIWPVRLLDHQVAFMAAWKIGVVDGLVFMAVWGAVLVMVSPVQFWALGFASLLPVVLVVAALGRLQAIEIRHGRLSLLQASIGGAKWGAIISAIFVAVVLAFDSQAAGGHLDGQPFFSWATLHYVIVFGAPAIFLGSVAGAAHAVAFYVINSLLVSQKWAR